jgi:Mce-associated membrane protein
VSPKPPNSGDERDLYELLGVGRDADAAQISKAWRKRTRRAGPGSPEFTRLNDAAETLLNPDRRAEYDATLPAPEPVAGAPVTTSVDPENEADRDPASVRPPAGGTAAPRTGAGAGALVALWVLVGALLVGVIAAGAYALHLHGEHSDDRATDTARTEALAAARQAMGVVLAYSYKTMDADLQRDLNYLTPSFGKEFSDNFALLTKSSGGAKSPVQQTKTIVTVAVKGAAVMDASPDQVHVLVFADQTTVHKAGPRKQACPCVLANRVQVSMVKQHGTWLVNDLKTS